MRHVILSCKNHPNLRWSTKEIACNAGGKPGDPALYNSSRSINFCGESTGEMYSDLSGVRCTQFVEGPEPRIVHECSCPASDLVIAPEDSMVRRT